MRQRTISKENICIKINLVQQIKLTNLNFQKKISKLIKYMKVLLCLNFNHQTNMILM
jgi:hypothetical protein